ncbi:MAG: hypothetical protein LBL77_02585 [Endomicrobium sp.]|jgi:hypothetical protein|nr:hypothetical protein [Endomicrobium sp.]
MISFLIVLITFSSSLIFAGQVININHNVGHTVYGNGKLSEDGAIPINSSLVGNKVNINDGSINGDIIGSFSNTIVKDNIITINGGVVNGEIFGAVSKNKNGVVGLAENNTVIINNAQIFKNVYGAKIDIGKANNNRVIINGGKIEDVLVFGACIIEGPAMNNKISISTNKNVNIKFICGGLTTICNKYNTFTGNTLNIKTSGLIVTKGISKIQIYNFYLPANLKSGDVMLTVNGGGQEVYLIDNGSNIAIDNTPKMLELQDTIINVYRSINYDKLIPGNKITLIESNPGFLGKMREAKFILKQGFATLYDCDISLEHNTLNIIVKKEKFNKQTIAFSEGYIQAISFINRGTDFITNCKLSTILESVSQNASASIAGFGIYSYDKHEYRSKANFNTNSNLFLGGIVKKINLKIGYLMSSLFCEYGLGDYNTFDSFEDTTIASIEGYGNDRCIGCGLLERFSFNNGLYSDISWRIGIIENHFLSPYMLGSNDDMIAQYKYDSLYYGAHFGIGYLCNLVGKFGLDTYCRYFSTYIADKDVSLPDDGLIKFANVKSNRFRIGIKLFYDLNKLFNFCGGYAIENESDGTVNASIADKSIESLNLKGNTSVIEIGFIGKNGDFCINLQGSGGLRKSFTGMVKISFDFVDYFERFIGFSIKKFKNEKKGYFDETFDMSTRECFNRTLEIIRIFGARVTHKNLKEGYIIAFDFSKSFNDYCLDSTEVGIFIKDIGNDKIKVEVISNNNVLAKEFSNKFFEMLLRKKS